MGHKISECAGKGKPQGQETRPGFWLNMVSGSRIYLPRKHWEGPNGRYRRRGNIQAHRMSGLLIHPFQKVLERARWGIRGEMRGMGISEARKASGLSIHPSQKVLGWAR